MSPAAETPWEEALFALAELEGKDVVRCAFDAELSGPIDGAGLLMLEHAELRAGVLTAVLSERVPYGGRAVGVVSIDGDVFEVRVQRAPDAPIADCDVRPSAAASVEDWPQIERVAEDGTLVSEDWPLTALGSEDVHRERDRLGQRQSTIQDLLTDPGLSSEARLVLADWMEARASALERAANNPNVFLLR